MQTKKAKRGKIMEMKSESNYMEEDGGLGWGKSLPVPSVQEMVNNDSHTIPHRYIRDHKDRPLLDDKLSPTNASEIPIIDFSLLAKRDQHELNKLHFACQDWGFFQIINHGVGEELMQKMKDAEKGFFDLKMEEKQKYSMTENDIQGYGQAFVVSEDQKLDWADLMFLVTNPHQCRNLKYWPLTVPGFKETVEEYTREISRVCEGIFGNLSMLMGMEEEGLKELHQQIKLAMRMNYYPPCPKPELVLGISPHSDGGSITILLQDDHVTALQIHHHGHWIPVKPLTGAFVVNVGDALEVWSNGRYKSVEHRAVTNESKARMSIAMFVAPHDGAEIAPLEPMLRHGPTLYRSIKWVEYARHYLGKKLDGKALDFLKIHASS